MPASTLTRTRPAQPARPARRCQACGYLPTAVGHRATCGVTAAHDDPQPTIAPPSSAQVRAGSALTPAIALAPPSARRSPDGAGRWRDLARCAEVDPELFYPEKGESTGPAKRICRSCEVRSWCLQDALDHHERFGVWGGLSERERRRLALVPVPARRCPAHDLLMSAGPVVYQCPAGHSVTAIDLRQAASRASAAA